MRPTIGVLIEPGTEGDLGRSRAILATKIVDAIKSDVRVVYIDSSQTTPTDDGEVAKGFHFPKIEMGDTISHWLDHSSIAVPLGEITVLHTNGLNPSQTTLALRRLQRRIPTINRMVAIKTPDGPQKGLLQAVSAAANQLAFGHETNPKQAGSILVAGGEPFARIKYVPDDRLIYEGLQLNTTGVAEAESLLALLTSEMGVQPSELVFGMNYVTSRRNRLTITGVDIAPQRIPKKSPRDNEGLQFALLTREARVLARMALSSGATTTEIDQNDKDQPLDIDAVLAENAATLDNMNKEPRE